jgi:hypothetical protein
MDEGVEEGGAEDFVHMQRKRGQVEAVGPGLDGLAEGGYRRDWEWISHDGRQRGFAVEGCRGGCGRVAVGGANSGWDRYISRPAKFEGGKLPGGGQGEK